MIISVTLNPALDQTLEVPSFTPGRRHRTVDQRTLPGGKGINVARVLAQLGYPVIVTGLCGGPTGERIIEALNKANVVNSFTRVREDSRTNTAVIDPTTGIHSEINERGPAVTPHELDVFEEKLVYLARGAKICVFAGSLPRGLEPDTYARLVRAVRKCGVTTVVDADGEAMRLAVRAEPDLVSPNQLEAEELVGNEFNDDDEHCQAVLDIVHHGPAEAIMTVPDGCYAYLRPGVGGGSGQPNVLYRASIPPLEALSPIGSGDAFLAGYLGARYVGESPARCLRYGVACGAESTQHVGAGIVDPAKIDRLLDSVEVQQLQPPAGGE